MHLMTAIGKARLFDPGQGTEHRIGPDRFVTKGAASDRSEAFSVIEYEARPGVPGPPPHVHRTWEEAWYILEGKVAFVADGVTAEAGPGAYLLVPRGVPHTFEVRGRRLARWVGIFSPGRFVGLVEELGAILPLSGPPDGKSIQRVFAKYDTEFAR